MKQNRQLRLILKDMDSRSWKTFPVKKDKISLPIQLDLFVKNYSKRAHITMGLFYELLCICLLGGRLADQMQIKLGLENTIIKPDIFNLKRKKIIESKAMGSGHQLNLLDDQIERYKVYQSLYPDYKIHFILWRHSLRNIKSYSKNLQSLIEDLCHKTLCSIILPFSLILKIHESKMFQRYESEKWDHCTRINSSFINGIFINPDSFFELICDKNDNFAVEYFMTPKISFSGNNIPPFPVAWIKDINYQTWVENFVEKFIPFLGRKNDQT